jgi:hypothetical protein
MVDTVAMPRMRDAQRAREGAHDDARGIANNRLPEVTVTDLPADTRW